MYVYQATTAAGGGGGGGLGLGLGLGGLALLLPLALFGFTTLFPTTAIVGRKRRETNNSTLTAAEESAEVLRSYMVNLRLWDGQLHSSLQADIVAKYLQCGAEKQVDQDPAETVASSSPQAPSLPACLEHLSCLYRDRTVKLASNERQVAGM